MIGGTIIAIFRGTHLTNDDGTKRWPINHVSVTVKENQGHNCASILLHPTNYALEVGAGVWWQGEWAYVTVGRREVKLPRLRVRWDGKVVTPGT